MATLAPLPIYQFFTDNGAPLAGGQLEFFDSGTSTPKATYADAGLTTPNTNPLILDAAGRAGPVFFEAGDYKVVLKSALGITIRTADPVQGGFTVSSFGQTLIDDLTAADARATIGVTYANSAEMEAGTVTNKVVSPAIASEWHAHRSLRAGLVCVLNATDSNNDVDIAAGVTGSAAAPWRIIHLATGITKQLDAAWAVGTNAGGLDTGTKANSTLYFVHVIRRSDTGVVDVLLSTSATAPTMPANYDQRDLIAVAGTDGSGNLLFVLPLSKTRAAGGYAALALATLYSVTHGLGTTPTRISGVAICSSADLNYARGDVVLFPSGQGGSDTIPSTTFGGRATATVATMRSPSGAVMIGNLTSGAQGGMTVANWYFLVLAEI